MSVVFGALYDVLKSNKALVGVLRNGNLDASGNGFHAVIF
jgi:hypothetical protein